MQRNSAWKAWLDATTPAAAERICERLAKVLGTPLLELAITPYAEGGHVVSWLSAHDSPDGCAFIVEVLDIGQRIATPWSVAGSLHAGFEGVASLAGRSRISLPGVTMLLWQADASQQ